MSSDIAAGRSLYQWNLSVQPQRELQLQLASSRQSLWRLLIAMDDRKDQGALESMYVPTPQMRMVYPKWWMLVTLSGYNGDDGPFKAISKYRGYTECLVTNNMRNRDVIDAIIIRLPITDKHNSSLCDYHANTQAAVQQSLAGLDGSIVKNLPVVFLEQARGMTNQSECDAVWGGKDCMNGYRKEIFAQSYDFEDGSCLAVPDGCRDVYFFPADKNGTCMISSEDCQQMEPLSPYYSFAPNELPSHSFSRATILGSESKSRSGSALSYLIPFMLPILAGVVYLVEWKHWKRRPSFRKACLLSSALFLLPLLSQDQSLSSFYTYNKETISAKNGTTGSMSMSAKTDINTEPSKAYVGPSWEAQQEWLCPKRVPNLDATSTTFRIAQQFFLGNETPELPRQAADRFFSHWPGHMLFEDPDTNKTALALRTYKCGSMTLLSYFRDSLGPLGSFSTSLFWKDYPKQRQGCIVTAFRDPVSHFISGLGEIENRRERRPKKTAFEYEKLPLPSQERFLAFVEFVLRGDWRFRRLNKNPRLYAHVFPQSGYFVSLHSVRHTVSSYLDMHNIQDRTREALIEDCQLPDTVPKFNTTVKHHKIDGLDSLLKELWTNETSIPRIHRAFEAVCILNAVDYACLAPELREPPPEVCARAFQKYLPLNRLATR